MKVTCAKSFCETFEDLPNSQKVEVTEALVKLELGKLGNVKPIRSGVSEFVIDTGPGLRIYFSSVFRSAKVTGFYVYRVGTKKTQQRDINCVIALHEERKARNAKRTTKRVKNAPPVSNGASGN